jgi:hypothetical protein
MKNMKWKKKINYFVYFETRMLIIIFIACFALNLILTLIQTNNLLLVHQLDHRELVFAPTVELLVPQQPTHFAVDVETSFKDQTLK